MTITVHNERIPGHKFREWQEILKATGGRYLQNPRVLEGAIVVVDYEPGDYQAMNEAWARCNTPISETRKDQPWRRQLRRIMKVFK